MAAAGRDIEAIEQRNADLGETLAMALAEIGEFGEAVNVQRGLLRAAERSGMRDHARWIAANLRLYEQRRPCRTPWFNEDPEHRRGTAEAGGAVSGQLGP
jgi:hypothetical protein